MQRGNERSRFRLGRTVPDVLKLRHLRMRQCFLQRARSSAEVARPAGSSQWKDSGVA